MCSGYDHRRDTKGVPSRRDKRGDNEKYTTNAQKQICTSDRDPIVRQDKKRRGQTTENGDNWSSHKNKEDRLNKKNRGRTRKDRKR